MANTGEIDEILSKRVLSFNFLNFGQIIWHSFQKNDWKQRILWWCICLVEYAEQVWRVK